METKGKRIWSNYATSPGEVLAEEIAARGMTQKELAARMGRPAQVINEIIKAKKAVTPDTALGLEKVLGIDAEFWTNLEASYRMTLARIAIRERQMAQEQRLQHYPIRDMIKRQWIEAGRDKSSRLKALQFFLGADVADPRVYQKAVGYRVTESALTNISLGALVIWLRKGELEAEQILTAAYDQQSFCQALTQIRTMTGQLPQEFLPKVSSLCAEAGVAFCLVQELPKSGANGVARWLTNSKALIQMSLRHKWADIFWFTFFHEACHLLKHKKQHRFVIDGLADPELKEIECEADAFARDFLIPLQDWNDFTMGRNFTQQSIQAFAQAVNIAPFIVVGRLQKEKLIAYKQFADLKVRYIWPDPTP